MSINQDPSLNAVQHGAASQRLFIAGEKPEEFNALLVDLFTQFKPATNLAGSYVFDLTRARWILDRRQRVHADHEALLHRVDPSCWEKEQLDHLNLFDRYMTQAERALRRASINARSIAKEAAEHESIWRAQLAIHMEKVRLEIQRFELQQAKDAHRLQEVEQPPAPGDALQIDPDLGAVLVQQAVIRVDAEGQTVLEDVAPSHRTIRQKIQACRLWENPVKVVRYFTFLNNVPLEYAFLHEAGLPRTDQNHRVVRCLLNIESYNKLTSIEDRLLTIQMKAAA